MIRFDCPKCGAQLRAPPDKIGVSAPCRSCKARVTVPFRPEFLAGLNAVHDLDIEKDPDEYVAMLADAFNTRRSTVSKKRRLFLESLKFVCDVEGVEDPDEYVALMASRLLVWRSHSRRQMQEYLSAVSEDDPLRCPISLFGTVGLGRLETAHTSTLAWLLHPRPLTGPWRQEHGFGTSLMEALLAHLLRPSMPSKLSVDEVHKEYKVLVSEELDRMDVYATGSWADETGIPVNWLLAIEAKIDASEGDQQLERYDRWIDSQKNNRRLFRVFLTPEGRNPDVQPQVLTEPWIPLSFLDLVRIFRQPSLGLRGKPGFQLLRFYLTGILKDIYRWAIPVPPPESCANPYEFVAFLKTVHKSSHGEHEHGSPG